MSGSQEKNTLHADGVIVQVKQGILRGTIRCTAYNAHYNSFLNIPYAAPPIGDLRFKDPQPPACWEGIRDANQHENVCCAQMTRYPKSDYIGSEDCLYLNIYVPFRIQKKTGIAVMVWIHGGYFFSGSGNFTEVRPDYFIDKDVILVTVNYRLGAFGFLNLEHVVASGNQGLKDQVAALQWIKENIAVFGGDPNNVTVFGSNVGAVCVHLLMLSPLSRDLFHKAILQGGVATMSWATEHYATVNYSYRLATELGSKSSNPAAIVEFLNKISAVDIIRVHCSMMPPKEASTCEVVFGPSIDKYAKYPFLECSPCELLHFGNRKPVILGHTSYEYFRLLRDSSRVVLETLYHSIPIYVAALQPRNGITQTANLAKRCQKYYFRNKLQAFSLRNVLRCYGDIYFNIPITMIADERRKLTEAPTYVYEFSYVGNQKIIDKNLYFYEEHLNISSQGDDLAYLFFTPIHKGGNISPPVPETDDFEMIEIMTSMWTNFAMTGDPIPVENRYTPIKWKPATKENLYCLEIDRQLRLDDRSSIVAFYGALLAI